MQVKGTAIRTVFVAIEGLYGREGLSRVEAALPDMIRAVRHGILPATFYPVAISAAIHESIRRELGSGRFLANRRVGRRAAEIDFSGVYQVFMRAMDYPGLLERMARAWRQYNSQGELVWTSVETGRATLDVVDVTGWTEPMWHALAGRMEGVLCLGGASRAVARVDLWSAEGAHLGVEWVP